MTDDLYTTILGKKKEDVLNIIINHIDKKFGCMDISSYEHTIIQALEKNKEHYLKKMEALTKHPIPYETIEFCLTTLPCCPYHREKGQIRIYYKTSNPVGVFLHELLHFQFHRRYRSHTKVKSLSQKQFEDLKEALTFLLNIEFHEYIERPDTGYETHKELRKKLEEYRISSDKNFEKLIEYGCDIMLRK